MARIRFILGRAGTGKTTRCVNAAADALRGEGASPLALLTPEQATYQMEYAVLSRPGVRGFSRLRVLSFNRLGFWLNRRADNRRSCRGGRQMRYIGFCWRSRVVGAV
jgi:ATP-dependent helicase/DNAse subunit B